MPAASRLKYAYLAFFSKPKAERRLVRHVRRRRVLSIVEFGVGDLQRAGRLISVAQRYAGGQTVRYTGVDLFEAAGPDATAPPLKQAHRRLADSGAKVRLVPGEPSLAIRQVANTLLNNDLVIFSAGQFEAVSDEAWFFVPRMLSAQALVVSEERVAEQELKLSTIDRAEIDRLARQATPRRAA